LTQKNGLITILFLKIINHTQQLKHLYQIKP